MPSAKENRKRVAEENKAKREANKRNEASSSAGQNTTGSADAPTQNSTAGDADAGGSSDAPTQDPTIAEATDALQNTSIVDEQGDEDAEAEETTDDRVTYMRNVTLPPPPPKPAQPDPRVVTDDLKMPDPVAANTFYRMKEQGVKLVDQRDSFKNPTQATKNAAKKANSLDVHAIRYEFAEQTGKDVVLTNHFTVDVTDNTVLYEYHIEGMPEKVSRAKRKTLVMQMISKCPVLAYNGDKFATDYHDKIIAWTDLSVWKGQDNSQGFEPLPPKSIIDTVPVMSYDSNHGSQAQQHSLRLTYRRSISFQSLSDYVKGRKLKFEDDGISDALNIVFSGFFKDTADNPDIIQHRANRFFTKSGWNIIDEYLNILSLRGYFFSVHPKMGQLTMNVNTVMSTFHHPETVQEFLERTDFAGQDDVQKDKLKSHLTGLRVRIMYSRANGHNDDIDDKDRRTRTITGFGEVANVQTFTQSDGVDISVYDYISGRYPNVTFGSQDQLCVNVGSTEDGKETWFLPEHLHILSGQMYKHKLSDAQISNMIEQSCKKPSENRALITNEGLKTIGLGDEALDRLRAIGMDIDPRMMLVPRRLLRTPTVNYRNDHPNPVEVKFGAWSTRGKQFITSTQTDKTKDKNKKYSRAQFIIPIAIASRPDYVEHYVRNFLEFYRKNGVGDLENSERAWRQYWTDLGITTAKWDLSTLKTRIEEIVNDSGADLLVLILPKNDAKNRRKYAAFKTVTDQYLGIKSICMSEANMEGSFSKEYKNWEEAMEADKDPNRMLAAYMAGIAMKLNLRLGNTNHHVGKGPFPKRFWNDQGTANTIILGADLVHPGVGSAEHTPSIAAVVGSTDEMFTKFPGSIRHQTGRVEVIEDMQDMVDERLRAYHATNKVWPRKIVYYRDGIDESQYKDVRKEEVAAIKEAWHGLKIGGDFQLTVVIVSKRHHTRLFPHNNSNSIPVNGNCLPGTVVESGITSPYYLDFFLQSHKALQGTARPTHYFVLENSIGLSATELQDMTYALCHNYARGTTAVSYAAPAYYADHLAERGKIYLRPLFDGDDGYKNKTQAEVDSMIDEMWERGNGGKKGRKNPWHKNFDDKMFWL